MGWIVRHAVARYRYELGTYLFEDWECCAQRIGLTVIITDMGPTLPAALIKGRLLIDHRLPPHRRAELAWHEIAHHLLHAGNMSFWLSQPGGEHYVRKLERQCWEFVKHFPVRG